MRRIGIKLAVGLALAWNCGATFAAPETDDSPVAALPALSATGFQPPDNSPPPPPPESASQRPGGSHSGHGRCARRRESTGAVDDSPALPLSEAGNQDGGLGSTGHYGRRLEPGRSLQRPDLHQRSQRRIYVESGLVVFCPPHQDRRLRIRHRRPDRRGLWRRLAIRPMRGLETRIDDPNSLYGLVLPQFYLEVAYNDLTVKMGHFATLTSLEVVPAPLNFFYSHTYLMGGYYDPLLVTGLQAEYKLNDNWTAIGGFNQGWQLFENQYGDTLNFLGGVKWASDDKKSTLSVMVTAGPTQTFAGFHDVDECIMVYTHQFTDRFWSGTQVTVGRENDGSVINPGRDDQWYGFEQLFTYKLNDRWSAGPALRMGPRQPGLASCRHRQCPGDRCRMDRHARFRRPLQRSDPGAELPSQAEHHFPS